ncbi:MAG: DUF1569 domain-containing protein [Ferruginibacter sp.]
MDQEKFSFLQEGMFERLQPLSETTPAKWGVMNAQQMTEHVTDFFDVSYEKIIFPLSTPEEHLPKYKAFLYSDKTFRENTKAPAEVLGDTPMPYRTASLDEAKTKLRASVDTFIIFFENNPGKLTLHPAFGLLNFEEWVLLHYKHVVHHFKQFGLVD